MCIPAALWATRNAQPSTLRTGLVEAATFDVALSSPSEPEVEEPPSPAPATASVATPPTQAEPAPSSVEAAPPPQPPPHERRLKPPGPGASRKERVTYARRVVERIRRAAVEDAQERGRVDETGRIAGPAVYPQEQRTEQPLVLSAIVTPTDQSPFAVIEHEDTGMVASYSAGNMLWPGVLPGTWVIDVRPGVVHLLDLESTSFEFLTFEKPLTPKERRAQERRERARERREAAKRRREARRSKRRR